MFLSNRKNAVGEGVVDVSWVVPDAISLDWDAATFDGDIIDGISGTYYYSKNATYVFAPDGVPDVTLVFDTTPITDVTENVATLRDAKELLPPGETLLPPGATILNERPMAECEYTVTADTSNIQKLGFNKWLRNTKEMAEYLMCGKSVYFQWNKPATSSQFLATINIDIPEWGHNSGFRAPSFWCFATALVQIQDSNGIVIGEELVQLQLTELGSAQISIDFTTTGLINGQYYYIVTYVGTSQSMYDSLG